MLVRIDHSSCYSARPFFNWMVSIEVLFLSIPRAEVENPKPRIVHFWRKVNEGLQVQEKNACCHVLTDATMSCFLHNGLMVSVERFVVSDRVREM